MRIKFQANQVMAEENKIHSAAQTFNSLQNCKVKYEFSNYRNIQRFISTISTPEFVKFDIKVWSPYNVLSIESGIDNPIDCRFNVDYKTGDVEKVSILGEVGSGETSNQVIQIDKSKLQGSGELTVNLDCEQTNLPDDYNICSMEGNGMIIKYDYYSLSGCRVLVVSQIRKKDVTSFRDDLSLMGMTPKSSYTIYTVKNQGYATLRYNSTKYDNNDAILDYIEKAIKERFTNFSNIIKRPISKADFEKENYPLGDCSEHFNRNGQQLCYSPRYKFDSLAVSGNAFNYKLLSHAENLDIDFIIIIPRIEN
ncbi:MAG: hypothetical protein WC606_01690 [Candidatus Absconditabacterales bacterium]